MRNTLGLYEYEKGSDDYEKRQRKGREKQEWGKKVGKKQIGNIRRKIL